MIARLSFLFLAIGLVGIMSSCQRGATSDVPYETVECKGKCMIVFKPDSNILKKKLEADKEFQFTETLSDHEHYTRELKKMLTGTDITLVESTSRFILVNTGSKQRKFEARDKEDGYPLGVILSRPDGEPMIHFGLFTDLEYKEMIDSYFR